MTTLLTTRYLYKAPFDLEGLGIELPPMEEAHPNRVAWTGVLTRLAEPSTRPPGGAEGHRVVIPSGVAEQALPSLIGMPVNFSDALDDHNKKQPVGAITEAHIAGKDLVVSGILYGKNFPHEVDNIKAKKHQLGMSYEIGDCEIVDPQADIWELAHFMFTGAAILFKDKAAYAKTSIAAHAEELSMADSTAIIDKLTDMTVKLDLLAAHDASADEAAARQDEEQASALDAEAARLAEQAARARADADESDAAAKDEQSAAKRTAAFQARMAAAARYEALAARCKAAGDEDAASTFTASAKRMSDENAKWREAETAAAQRASEQQAAAKKKSADDDDDDDMPKMFGMFLRAMRYAQDEDAMTYPSGVRSKRRSTDASADHPDEAQDKALIRRLLTQERGDQKASTPVLDMRTRRELRELRASNELITDALTKMTGLITDVQHQLRNLATDQNRGQNGGPVRKTMQATGEAWVSKFDERQAKDGTLTAQEIDAQAKEEGLDERARMARVIEASMNGTLKP